MDFTALANKGKEAAYEEKGGSFLLENKTVYPAFITDWEWKWGGINLKLDVEVGDKQYKTAFSSLKFDNKITDPDKITKLFSRVELLGVMDLVDTTKADLETIGASVMDAMNKRLETIKKTKYAFYCSHYTGQDGTTKQSMTLVFDGEKKVASNSTTFFDKSEELPF